MEKKRLWIGAAIVGAAAGIWYVVNQVKLIDKLCYYVTGYKVVSLAAQGARIDLDLSVRNLGKLKVKVKKFKFNVFADGEFIATAYSDQQFMILPNQVGSTSFQILLNPKSMLQNIGATLQNAEYGWQGVEITLDGGVFLSKGGIPFYIPITYPFKLSEFTKSSEVESPC